MKIFAAYVVISCSTLATPVFSATLVATHQGVMCSNADALAKLSLPDGSSRTSFPNARPEDLTVKQSGGCVDFGPGTQVTVITPRKNTSIVTYNAGDGRGPREFTVPNIDFASVSGLPSAANRHIPQWPDADYPPLVGMNKLLSAVAKQCPQQGWTGNKLAHTEVGPWFDTIKPTPAQSAAIDKAEQGCDGAIGMACVTYTHLGVEVQFGYLPQLVKAVCSEKAPAE